MSVDDTAKAPMLVVGQKYTALRCYSCKQIVEFWGEVETCPNCGGEPSRPTDPNEPVTICTGSKDGVVTFDVAEKTS